MSDNESNWQRVNLGDVCTASAGGTPNRSDPLAYGGDIPWVKSGEVASSDIWTTEERITTHGMQGSAAKMVDAGSVLIAMYGATAGQVARLKIPAATNQAVLAIRPKGGVLCADFLYHCLCQSKSDLIATCQGSGQPNLNAGIVKGLEIYLPPLPEQKKIAEILSGIDDSISKEWEKIRVLQEIRRASLKNLTFGKGAQAQRIDSGTEFGLIPSHWTCEQIPNCCLIENSKRKPIKKEDRSQMRGTYPYHGATRIQDYISEFAYEGEYVLIGEDGDHFSKFDDWEMAQFASGRFNVSNHAHVITGTDRCRTKWLFYSLLHRDLTLHLTRQGATRFKLSKASLECIPILIPPLTEQDRMINLFDSISGLIELRSKKVEKLNAAKAAIANDLLTGRKRVSV